MRKRGGDIWIAQPKPKPGQSWWVKAQQGPQGNFYRKAKEQSPQSSVQTSGEQRVVGSSFGRF